MPTETACTTAVATVMPISTGTGLKRVANVSAMSCDLSPSSATKITAKLSAVATRNPSMRTPGEQQTGARARGDLDPAGTEIGQVEGLARPGLPRPPGRALEQQSQYVDHDVGSYSPSRDQPYRPRRR